VKEWKVGFISCINGSPLVVAAWSTVWGEIAKHPEFSMNECGDELVMSDMGVLWCVS
jgi:hypothetical protein